MGGQVRLDSGADGREDCPSTCFRPYAQPRAVLGGSVESLEEALQRFATPDNFYSVQGSQFTFEASTGVLTSHGIATSMDGKGRWLGNVFVERLRRSVKYEDLHFRGYETPAELRYGLADSSSSTTPGAAITRWVDTSPVQCTTIARTAH